MCNPPEPSYQKLIMTVNLCEEIIKDECTGTCECKLILSVQMCEGEEKILDCPPPCHPSPFDEFSNAVVKSHCKAIKVFSCLKDDIAGCSSMEKVGETVNEIKDVTCGAVAQFMKCLGLSEEPCPRENKKPCSKPKDVAFSREEEELTESIKRFFRFGSMPRIIDKEQVNEVQNIDNIKKEFTVENLNNPKVEANKVCQTTNLNIIDNICTVSNYVKNTLRSYKDAFKNMEITVPEKSSPYDVPKPRDP